MSKNKTDLELTTKSYTETYTRDKRRFSIYDVEYPWEANRDVAELDNASQR